LGIVKLFYSFSFDPNKNTSRGFVPLGERSISTRGKNSGLNLRVGNSLHKVGGV
jgi:hypothetical protein